MANETGEAAGDFLVGMMAVALWQLSLNAHHWHLGFSHIIAAFGIRISVGLPIVAPGTLFQFLLGGEFSAGLRFAICLRWVIP